VGRNRIRGLGASPGRARTRRTDPARVRVSDRVERMSDGADERDVRTASGRVAPARAPVHDVRAVDSTADPPGAAQSCHDPRDGEMPAMRGRSRTYFERACRMTTALYTSGESVATLLSRSLSPSRLLVQVAKSLAYYILYVPFNDTLATLGYRRDRIPSRQRHPGASRAYRIGKKRTASPSPKRLPIGSTVSRQCGARL
jgi:hypothetical protein